MDVTSKTDLISGYCFNETVMALIRSKRVRRVEDFYFEAPSLVPYVHSVPYDVIIEVEGQLFKVHRSVLAEFIPYFQNMFSHNWCESANGVITMANMSADMMKYICRFAYTGKFLVTYSHLEELWYAADYLSWNNLLASMSRHLSLILDPENVFRCINMSERVNDFLHENAMRFLRQYFVYLMNEEAFLDLEFRHLTEVLGHDCLNVPSEKPVLKAMVKWLRHDFKNRKQYLKELINGNFLRKRFLSNKDLRILTDDPVLGERLEVRMFLEEFQRNRTLARKKNIYPAVPRMPFNPALSIGEVILVSNVYHRESCILKYFPQTGKWQRFSSIVGYSYFSAIIHKDKLFIVGGDADPSDGVISTRISCLDLDDPNASFYNRAPMSTARSCPGLVAQNDFIYVIGGEGHRLPTIERYSVSQNKWKRISQAKSFVRFLFACCIVKDCIYIIGGCDTFMRDQYMCGIMQQAMVEIYNISENRWSFAAAMLQESRYDCSVAILDGYIYVVGGKSDIHSMDQRQALRSVERFSLDEQRFEYVASLNYARSQCVLVASLGRLWAFGGLDGDNTRLPIEVYDPAVNCWIVVGRMPALFSGVSGGYRMYQ